MSKLSIIVCLYNTPKSYFEECLNSIYNSTVEDFEVIVVDDGSTIDYSDLVGNYKNLKYFKQENKGTLKARIFGVKQASADHVCFVDSDDTVSFCYHEASLITAQDSNSDIVINDWAFHTERTKYVCTNDTTIKTDLNLIDDDPLKRFIMQAGQEHSWYVLWNKIFKREILLKACEKIETLNIDRMVFSEDVLINYFAFSYSTSLTNVHMGYYFYRVHDDQQVSVTTKKKLRNHIDSMTTVFDFMEEDLQGKKFFDEIKKYFQMWKQLMCSTNYQVATQLKMNSLYNFILKKYRTCKLERMSSAYNKAYAKQKLLPINLEDIDKQLKEIYYKDNLKVLVKKKTYTHNIVSQMNTLLGKNIIIVKKVRDADIVINRELSKFKYVILHNPFFYKVGILLFPKGSKIRKYLKSKL